MSIKTGISWCHHTASPWFVCTEVDECCANCYARVMTQTKFAAFIRLAYKRAGYAEWETMPVWGKHAPRVMAQSFWKNFEKWNGQAKKAGEHRRVFTSLMDWLDDMPAGVIYQDGARTSVASIVGDYLKTIYETPWLTHLMLTKRPENFRQRLKEVMELWGLNSGNDSFVAWLENWLDGTSAPGNVWFGWTAGTKEMWKERHEIARDIPAQVRWCSAEPLLEDLSFEDIEPCIFDWIVIGGESGKGRRDPPNAENSIISLANNARMRMIKTFVKQDCAFLPGMQGRLPPEIFAIKEFPDVPRW